MRLGPVATREIEAILAELGAAAEPLAARLARISGGRPGAARTLAGAPGALSARDEIGRSLLDLLAASPATRLAAARDLTALATAMFRALDRAGVLGEAADGGVGAAAPGRGRGRAKAATAAVAPPAAGGSAGDMSGAAGRSARATAGDGDRNGDTDGGGDGDGGTGGDGAGDESGSARTAVPAAERRRAAGVLVGLWREVARDLLVVMLGAERQVRDPALLDDLREAAPDAGSAAQLGDFLSRLDAAGELLEANVRPELVLDSLLLHWPRGTVAGGSGR